MRFADSPAVGQRGKVAIVAAVALVHLGLLLALLRGLAGVAQGLNAPVEAFRAITVPLTKPTPPPPPKVAPAQQKPPGAEGEAGRKARPKAVAAPRAVIPPRLVVPPVASDGNASRSGASAAGAGTGGGRSGAATGSGDGGNGMGARYVAQRAVKIAGDITSTRDFPARGREGRIGRSVIVVLRIGTDGTVRGCRVQTASGDAEADAITCRLATARFRFRPALDQTGEPIESDYGWQQRWFAP